MKKKISLIMALLMIFAMGTSVLATEVAGPNITTNPNDPAQSQVKLTAAATTFSVTVPMELPLEMGEDGKVVTTAGLITNNSYGPVEIIKEEITAVENWILIPYATEMKDKDVGSNLLGFCLNGNEVTTEGGSFVFFDKNNGGDSGTYGGATASRIIPGIAALGEKSDFHINYRAKVPARSTAITDTVVAHVVFTFAWDTN